MFYLKNVKKNAAMTLSRPRPEQIDIVEDGQDSILAKATICALYNMKKTVFYHKPNFSRETLAVLNFAVMTHWVITRVSWLL